MSKKHSRGVNRTDTAETKLSARCCQAFATTVVEPAASPVL